MILTPHLLVGAAIGAEINNFGAIFILIIILHFIFDRLPHWEYGQQYDSENLTRRQFFIWFLKALIDLTLGAGILFFLAKDSPGLLYIVFGAFAGILPDGLAFLRTLFKTIFGLKIRILEKHYFFHRNNHVAKNKNPQFWGAIIEGLVVAVAIFLLIT